MRNFFIFLLTLLLCFAETAVAEPPVLNISYVKSPFNLQLIIMHEKNILEKHMKKIGVEVKWHEITSGSQQARAMASEDLDIGGVMNSASVLIANAEGNNIRVIASVSRPLRVFGIVAGKGGIKSIRELHGKTVAGPKGTVLHQILVAALKKHGMTIHDINFVQMAIPRALAALKSRSVDAALLAANTLLLAQHDGDLLLADAVGLAVPKLMMTASERFVRKHSDDLLPIILDAYKEASTYIKDHHAEAIAIGAKEQGVTVEDAEKLFQWSNFTDRFTESDMKSMEDDMEFLIENNMMRNRVNIRNIFLPCALN